MSLTEIPGYGDKSAVTMCERLDIKSTKDKDKLKVNIYCLFVFVVINNKNGVRCGKLFSKLLHCALSVTLTLTSKY